MGHAVRSLIADQSKFPEMLGGGFVQGGRQTLGESEGEGEGMIDSQDEDETSASTMDRGIGNVSLDTA